MILYLQGRASFLLEDLDADSGPFVSNAHKNMTWTILALSMRTAEHIVEEKRKGNL